MKNFKVFLDNVYFVIFDASKYTKEEFEKIIHNEDDISLGIKDYEGLKIELQGHKAAFDKSANVSSDDAVDETAEGFLKGCIILMGTIFGALSINLWINNKLSVLKLVGVLVTISAISQASYRLLDLMNNSVDDGSKQESQKITNFIQKVDAIINNPIDQTIRLFAEEYYKFDARGSYVISAKYIEDFFKKQELFMLKKENIGVKNVKYYERLEMFYSLISGKPNAESLIVNYAISGDEFKVIRADLRKHLSTIHMVDTFDGILEKIKHKGESSYKTLFGKEGVLEEYLLKLSEQFNLVYDVDTCLKYVMSINNLLQILEHAGLPEYKDLKYELIFNGIPEFFEFYDMDNRYHLVNESQSIERLKENFKTCGGELSTQSKYINDICSRFDDGSTKDKIIKSYQEIIHTVTEESKMKKMYLDRYRSFIRLAKTESIVKKYLLSDTKHKDIVTMIGKVYKEIFIHSDVNRQDLIAYVKKKTQEENQTTLYVNSKKVIDIIFDGELRSEHDLIPIKDHNVLKNQYIDFDNFRLKLDSYTDDDLKKLHDSIKYLENEIDSVIRVKKTIEIDTSNEKKMTIFRDSVYLYIAASMFFVLDFFKDQMLTNRQPVSDTQSGGANKMLKYLKTKTNEIKNQLPSKSDLSSKLKQKKDDLSSKIRKQTSKSTIPDMSNDMTDMSDDDTTSNYNNNTDMSNDTNSNYNNNDINQVALRQNNYEVQAVPYVSDSKENFYDKMKSTATANTNLSFNTDKLINVSVVVAGWILSVVMLFSSYMKMDSNMNYNAKVKYNNSVQLKVLVKKLNVAATGLYKSKNKVESQYVYYEALISVLSSQTKCNNLKMNPASVPFPTTEVMVSFVMIGICGSIIVSQNMLNNPFEVMNTFKAMKAQTSQQGGASINELHALERFNDSLLDTKQDFFVNVTVAFTVMSTVMYICYRLLNNTLRYKSELFNGKLFGESICYNE